MDLSISSKPVEKIACISSFLKTGGLFGKNRVAVSPKDKLNLLDKLALIIKPLERFIDSLKLSKCNVKLVI